jgi:hypothetical protein
MRKALLEVNPNGIEFINFSFTMGCPKNQALRTRPKGSLLNPKRKRTAPPAACHPGNRKNLRDDSENTKNENWMISF